MISRISSETGISQTQIKKVLELLSSGATIPFIARYRKEATGSLDEVDITKIRDVNERLLLLENRRQVIINSLKEQNVLTAELEKEITNALTISELEDIYLPYKPKRKTRASIAKEKGLEPLAKKIFQQTPENIYAFADRFVSKEKNIENIEDALQGARDIIAEWINENKTVRNIIRNLFFKEGIISSKVAKNKETEGIKYKDYFSYEEAIKKIPSHRILALLRGENEGFLKVIVSPSETKSIAAIEKLFIKNSSQSAKQVATAIQDAYKRLLTPSIENETRAFFKEKADEEAIRVFCENLRQLLLAPPLGKKNVLAIDPGFKSGCKVVCLDKNGKLLHNENIYPHPPQNDKKTASNKLINLVNAYKIDAIAVGNGTAGRETEDFIKRIKFEKEVIAIMVNENGASVYSASAVARKEFPEYDVTVRGAVSIGRRLIDPLAELVKIEPKAIGVGQYQHDVDQTKLQKGLEETVISCVNAVGVDINTASKELLTYVSGIGQSIASNIVEYRNKNGAFTSRKEFMKIPRMGDKAFEQAAGFLRIIGDTKNPLDASAVHPESYNIVELIAKDMDCTVKELIENAGIRSKIKIKKYVNDKTGLPTLTDIMLELEKPGRDPRNKFKLFEFDKNIRHIEDLKEGMILPGIITNITAFGAFVDLGVHQDGLIHISNLTDDFVSDPSTIVKLHQHVKVKIMEVDINRKRIQLSMKESELN